MDVLALVESHLTQLLGEVNARASITFLGCEPIEVLRFRTESGATYATLGMSRHPMSDPTELAPDQIAGPRAELVVTLTPAEDLVFRALAIAAMSPTVEGLMIAEGATLDLGEPLWPGSPLSGFIVGDPVLTPLSLPHPAEPVRFFPLTAISAAELALARDARAS